ncbi:unnamed protein product [Nippostrongylus brasiliensis]|uniref:Chondroitin proteoglycan 3 n=1 Tax=Nippostrongylus brasiliensis TaxID=27835 RepID=A0A0N4Y4Z0_NIPBR|nr:unnamed protein product [Nippostrongylus brasiliensis]
MQLILFALLFGHALCLPFDFPRFKRDDVEGSGITVSSVDEAIAVLTKSQRADNDNAVTESTEATTVKTSKTCKPLDTCYNDDQCNGGKCFGTFVGTCDCQACKNFFICQSDADCGGLKGACNSMKLCDCNAGYKNAGYASFFDALTKFCHIKTCTDDKDCFGLTCTPGKCMCVP